ncbi:MAG: DUF362 domain-containing protein [Candidatus Bathyarchaeota archaeon]|nr:MAG: DUF362 domain-containing protein [Candidatus Bathyarchaeota archaeon]
MSKKAKVYFGSIQQGREALFAALAAKVDKIIELLDLSTIENRDKVAIKMHLGFLDGFQTVPVFFVRRVVKAVKKVGGWPFVTDNPTSVYNAVERGYTQETCGCPIIPAAGVKDGYTNIVKIGYKNVDKLEMGGALHDADALIDLTHSKGHACSGYGGAIKNLALGGYSAPSRWRKIHGVEQSIQYWDPDKCTPQHAKTLVKACPYGALKYDPKKHNLSLVLFACRNELCLECLKADEKIGCLQIKPEFFSAFQELMAINTKKVLETFDENKRFFLNYILQVTPHCDCMGMCQPSVVPDIGVLGSPDIVAIEQATLDLIAKVGLIDGSVPPYFKHANLDPSANLHPFERLWGPMKNPYLAIKFAEQYGLGSRKYDIVEILSPEETSKMKPPKQTYERQPSFY